MSKLEAIIALENQIEKDIAAANEAKEAMLEKARLEANKVISKLKNEQQAKIEQLQADAKNKIALIEEENKLAKEKLHKKIKTDYKDVTAKYLDKLIKEVTSK